MRRKLTAVALAALSMASITHAYTFSYQANSTWISNSYQSAEASGILGDYWVFHADGVYSEWHNLNYPGAYTNGVGQLFNVTNSFTVDKVRMWSARYYNTNDLYVTIYKNIDPTVDVPEAFMVPSNIVAEFTWDPGTTAPKTGSGGPGEVIEIALETNEYFDLAPLPTNQYYYYYVNFEKVDYGTNTPWRLFLWNGAGDYDPNGYISTPGGEYTDTTRELAIAFQSTNPPVVELPEIPTNWILPVADTYIRKFESGKTGTNYGADTSLGTRNYVSGTTYRDYITFIRFDLTEFANRTITNATLAITQSSGGNVSNPRVRFIGLDNVEGNTPQDWDEMTLTGDNQGLEFVTNAYASGVIPAGYSAFDFTNRVTDFEEGVSNVVESAVHPVASLSGPALVDWLNARIADDSLTNRYVTFIVDFPNTENQSVYYHSREQIGTLDQDKIPHLILEWTGGGPIGPQFDPTINTIFVSGSTVTLGWDSDSNGTYRVESKSDLTGGAWAPVTGATNLTGGAGQSTPVPVSGTEEFFRIYGE